AARRSPARCRIAARTLDLAFPAGARGIRGLHRLHVRPALAATRILREFRLHRRLAVAARPSLAAGAGPFRMSAVPSHHERGVASAPYPAVDASRFVAYGRSHEMPIWWG